MDLQEEFALDCPTLRSVPGSARAVAAGATEDLCRAVLLAGEGSLQEERAWKLLLLRERLLFWAPLRLSTGRRGNTEEERLDLGRRVRERVSALARGDWAALLAEARASARSLARSRGRSGATQRDERYLADEVVRKALAEEYSRAAALLSSPGLAPLNEETAEQLQELLQPRPAPPLAPGRRAAGEARDLFSRKDSKQALRSSPRGSGAALGGGRWEHWRVVLASPTALTAFHQLLLRVASGRLPESAAAALALSKLTPLRKPGGGVRPIAAPSLLRRMAGRLLVHTRRKELAEALGARQYAIGTAAGTELLAHTVRALTEADAQLVLTALDAKNAYCHASREACLAQLGELAPELLPCAELFCRRESRYFFWDGAGRCHELRATEGVDQGDPLAPLLFACGLNPRLRELEEALQDLAAARGLQRSRVRVLAFLDDLAVLTPPELAAEVLPTAQRVLGSFGLVLAPEKTQAWSASAARPDGLEERYWREAGLTLVGVPLDESLPEGGLPDHSDERRVDLGSAGYTEERCAEVAERAAAFLDRLAELPTQASPHQPAVQVAALLLRLCGAGKLTHLLRSNPPTRTTGAARAYDEALLTAYAKLAALDPLTESQQEQCQLPLRSGGRGLRSQERLAPAAWVGSWAQCLSEVLARSGVDSLEDLETSELPLARACREALAALPAATANDRHDEDLPTWRELALEPRKKVQKTLSRRLDKNNYSSLLGRLGTDDRARLRSCGGPLAAGWQLASPALAAERLEDEDYEATARTLLGQDLAAADRRTCLNKRKTGPNAGETCGAAVCSKAHHAHRCSIGGGLKSRSKAEEKVWASIHAECGFQTDSEVHVPAWDRWRWHCLGADCPARGVAFAPPTAPCGACGSVLESRREEALLDLEVRSVEVPRRYLDVTVRHSVPGNAEHLLRAANADGVPAREAEREKHLWYPAGRTPSSLVPLAVETYGRHGKEALRYLRKLARKQASQLEEGGERAASHLVLRWGCRLSVALHRANAANLRRCLGADLRKAGGRELACALAG